MELHTRDVHAVVIANRDVETLRPLTERTCAALLPVAGKPLLEHTLESLVLAGVRSGSVVVGPHAEQVERFLGTGERWGLALDMVLTRGDETEDEILSRLAIGRTEPLLAIRADRLRSPVVDTVLAADASGPGTGRWVSMGGVPAGVALITDASALRRRDVSSPPAAPGWEQRGDRIEIAGAFHPVDSVAGYHRANLSAVSGDVPGLILPGRRRGDGAVVGRQSTVPAAAVTGAPVFAGSRCLAHQGVELAAGTVLSDDVVVDRNATLIRTVVLPGTYVGESVELADAVVWSDVVVRVDSGVTARIADDFLLKHLVEMEFDGDSFNAGIPAEFFDGDSDFYLVINTAHDFNVYQHSLLTTAKLSTRDSVRVLVERSLPGVGLIHVPFAPPGLPRRPNTYYVRLDKHGERWSTLVRSHDVALLWQEAPDDAKIELVVLRR